MTTPVLHWEDGLDEEAPTVRHLFTAAEAERALASRAGTIRVWHHRGQLHAAGLDGRGRPMFDRDHLLRLHRNP